MTLAAGQSLGVYEILGSLGVGAMGEVYRARDTRLDREVAIKVLPEDFAKDHERLQRFEREAKSLASLNHSNIAQIYSVDQVDGTHFLSLELVPGETLDARLKRGPLPLEEALSVCRDIASGLEAAHEAGVIHRDLKPANVRVTPDGVTKILDFGLAKPVRSGSTGMTTQSMHLTAADGRVVGTPAYMSPEQIAGKPIDRRVDVWTFGCVLYECLTGTAAFGGDSLGSVFAAIATKSVDLDRIAGKPAAVRRLIERCLRKDPKRRLRDVGDARVELDDLLAGRAESETVEAPTRRRTSVGVLVGLLVVGVAIGWGVAPNSDSEPPPITRYSITLPPMPRALVLDSRSGMAPPLAISPDGRTIVFAARDVDGARQLYLRASDDHRIQPVDGSNEAENPSFSPDGKHLLFSHHLAGGLCRMARSDGASRDLIGQEQSIRGSSWGEQNTIVYALAAEGLVLIPASGGEQRRLIQPDKTKRERNYRWPQMLPGNRVLFTALLHDWRFEPRVYSLETEDVLPIPVQGSYARYVPGKGGGDDDGFLIYVRAENLWAVRIDLVSGNIGDPVCMVEGICVSPLGNPHLAVSESGVLVYEPIRPPSPGLRLVWVDRDGLNETTVDTGKGYELPRLSPDGTQVGFANHKTTGSHDIWTFDLERKIGTTVTSDGNYGGPCWSPEGDAIAFFNFTDRNLYTLRLGESQPVLLLERAGWQFAHQWTSEGRVLFHEKLASGLGSDLAELDLKDGAVRKLATGVNNERGGYISPDGRWLAYVSDATGRTQVYVRSYPALGPEARVSLEGGTEPVWSSESDELFFRNGTTLFSARIPTQRHERIGVPQELFTGQYVPGYDDCANYDVSADGKRFIMVGGGWDLTSGRLDVHLQFARELEEALPRHDN